VDCWKDLEILPFLASISLRGRARGEGTASAASFPIYGSNKVMLPRFSKTRGVYFGIFGNTGKNWKLPWKQFPSK